ncbi:cupredoxin domain-containing protein [Novosphingobium lentum]|uniref:cupredoxin domain-containing protein n=1 Tax=Novosphingobium lentum TaxID=145287 RepID=UPI0008316767|nr:cupredoxin domain-containing protein [Novosphingobium lentum]
MKRLFQALALAGFASGAVSASAAADKPVVIITLKDHRFTPDSIRVPAGQKITFDVTNRDATADDFDSDELHVDRDLKPHERATFVVGPLRGITRSRANCTPRRRMAR